MKVNLNKNKLNKIQYHVKTCYARYKKAGERSKKKVLGKGSYMETLPSVQITSPDGRHKRRKTVDTCDSRKKPCIICNQIKYKGSSI